MRFILILTFVLAGLFSIPASAEEGAEEISLPCYQYKFGSDGADAIVGTKTNDCITLYAGNDSAWGFHENDTLRGGGDADYLQGGCVYQDGTARCDPLDVQDVLKGNAGADILVGQHGNDYMYGGPGKDQLFGEGGNDVLAADDGYADSLNGGGGFNRCHVDSHDSYTNCDDVR